MNEERLYVEVKTSHNTYLGAHFKGKISQAIDFYLKRETFLPKGRRVVQITLSSDKAKTIFVV